MKKIDLFRNSPSKKIAMIILSGFLVSSANYTPPYLKPCQAPTPPTPQIEPMTAGYNYPARIEPARPWNIFAEMSFNYWQPLQENMELGQLGSGEMTKTTVSGLTTTFVATSDSFRAINMNFDFKPG